MPIFYECERCAACCRWPGQVRVSEDEITSMAQLLNMSEFDFIQSYTRLAADRRGLALMDKPNGECIFLKGNDCAVQAAKPRQCRAFPNGWNFPGFQKMCKAVSRTVTAEDYAALIAKSMGQ